MQVESSAVSEAMVQDAGVAEELAHSKLQSRQDTLAKEKFDKEMSNIAASHDSIQRKTSALRQVQ